jgi:hypothetical protein
MFSKLKSQVGKLSYELSKFKNNNYTRNLDINGIDQLFPTRNSKYQYFHSFFWNLAPDWLVDHRKYFKKNKRGFGEDAFHAMWYFIFKEFRPKDVLEIGVYRGQTISLFALLSKEMDLKTEIHAISPFTAAGDDVSKYSETLDYYNDVIENFKHFELPIPFLHKGFSTDKPMVEIIQSQLWDLIYIDGNHDYDVVKQDFAVCSKFLKKNGLIVLDDSSLYTDYKPSHYATPGHPGPSKVALEIDFNLFHEILSVGHNRVFKKI